MSLDISLIPQERIKDLISTLDNIQSNISTIDGNLTTTNSDLSTLQTTVNNNYTTLDNKIDSESSRIINIMDSDVVKLTGNQTIAGNKTFTDELNKVGSARFNAFGINDTSYDYLTNPSENLFSHIVWRDKNNKDLSYVQQVIDANDTTSLYNVASTYKTDGTRVGCSIGCHVNRAGVAWTSAPTPSATDNSTKIATTNWSKIVHPTYPNITTSTRVSVPANTDYSIPYDCWVWWGNTSYVGIRYLYVNGIEFGHSYGNSGHWEEFNTLFFPIKAGNVIRHTGDNSTCYLYQNVY